MLIFLGSTAYSGRAILASGDKAYMPLLYAHLRLLRTYNCSLPVEIWRSSSHDGPLSASQISAFTDLNATIHDMDQYIPQQPLLQEAIVGQGAGKKFFVFKHLTILASSCTECLFLDNDNMAVRDVTYLFDDHRYRDTGLVLWPDLWYFPAGKTEIRQILNLPYSGPLMRDYRTVESGQLLFDKRKSWASLMMALYLQVQEKFWQPLVRARGMGGGGVEADPPVVFSTPFQFFPDDAAAHVWWPW